MKLFALPACLLLLLPSLMGAAAESPPPLRFDKTPLGNAVRRIAPRLHAAVSIAANATAPVSGDFSRLDPQAALKEAARQAGLVVIVRGTAAAPEFLLAKPSPPAPEKTAPSARKGDPSAALASIERRRAELLRERAALLAAESRLEP